MSDQTPPIDGPDVADDNWQRTSPVSVIINAIRTLPQLILPLGAAAFSSGGAIFDNHGALLAGLSLFGLVLLVLAVLVGFTYLGWKKRRYRIGSSDIRLEQGIFARTARSVPYERIQDVSLEQKLLPRLLGLVSVRFETGAGGKDELTLTYVKLEQGEALRETIRARLDGAEVPAPIGQDVAGAEQIVAPSPVRDQTTLLFSMGLRRLVTFGIFEFSLAVLAVLFAVTQQLDFLLPFQIWDFRGWGERLSGPGATLIGLGTTARIIGAFVAVISLIGLGFAAGIIRTILRDYGFLLEKTAKGFRRRRGLLTKTDVVMPVHRVQAVTVTTGFIRRLFGWRGLSFISLAQDAKSSNHDVAPFAKMHEIAPISEAAKFALPTDALRWHRPAKEYRIDGAILGAVIPVIGAVVASFMGHPWVALPLLILAGAIAGREYFLWRYEAFSLDDAQVYSQVGWLAPKLTIAQRAKLHSVEITQGPIASRRGYCDLRFGLAGGKLRFDGLRLEDAETLRAEVLASIAKVDFADLAR